MVYFQRCLISTQRYRNCLDSFNHYVRNSTRLSRRNPRGRGENRLAAPEAVRDATILGREQDPTALGEGKDPTLVVEKDTLLVPPIPGAGLLLEVVDHAPQIRRHAHKVEQATDRNPKVGVTRNHGVGATQDHEAGIILVLEAEQDTLDLGVDHLTQGQRLKPGKMHLMTQTTMKQ